MPSFVTPCRCQTTGHDPGCWLGLSGYYVNGVKVANLPPIHILSNVTITVAPIRVTVVGP